MNDILSDLYHGELRPNEHGYPADSDVGILLESFAQNEKWLGDLLGGKAKEHLLELVNIHDELIPALFTASDSVQLLGFGLHSSLTLAYSLTRFLFVGSEFCLRLPSDSASRRTPLALAMSFPLPGGLGTFTR